MRKKFKAMIMALVCVTALLAQAAPAYAEEDHECEGGCVKLILRTYDIKYSATGGTTHKKNWTQDTRCTKCGTKRTEYMQALERCYWTSYTDLGHQAAQDHRYRLSCDKCGRSQEILITTCEAEWKGWHVTPW